MPIYEFACHDCGERFERLQVPSDPRPACPACGRANVARRISLIAGVPRSGSGNGASGGCGCGGACACGGR